MQLEIYYYLISIFKYNENKLWKELSAHLNTWLKSKQSPYLKTKNKIKIIGQIYGYLQLKLDEKNIHINQNKKITYQLMHEHLLMPYINVEIYQYFKTNNQTFLQAYREGLLLSQQENINQSKSQRHHQ